MAEAAPGPTDAEPAPSPAATPANRRAADGMSTITGHVHYTRDGNTLFPVARAKVEVVEYDVDETEEVIGTTWTQDDGRYDYTFWNTDNEPDGKADIRLRVYTEDYVDLRQTVKVKDPTGTSVWRIRSPIVWNIVGAEPVTLDFVIDGPPAGLFLVFDSIAYVATNYVRSPSDLGWEPSHLLEVRATYDTANPTSTQYDTSTNILSIHPTDLWDSDVILHEYGHFLMDRVYEVKGVSYPDTQNCSGHGPGLHTGFGCAWSEGWATFIQGAIQGSSVYQDPDTGFAFDLEAALNVHHPEDEGAVAASLWDIFDSGNVGEGWDNISDGVTRMWSILRDSKANGTSADPSSVFDFWRDWKSVHGYIGPVEAILAHHKTLTKVRNVRISNVGVLAVTVSWSTDTPVGGSVYFRTDPQQSFTRANDTRGANFVGDVHHVGVLTPFWQTSYQFSIDSNGQVDDNDGAWYSFTTGNFMPPPPAPRIVTGHVLEADGVNSAIGCLVLAKLRDGDGAGSSGESVWISDLTSDAGDFQLHLAARTTDLSTNFAYTVGQDVIHIETDCASRGVVSIDQQTSIFLDNDDLADVGNLRLQAVGTGLVEETVTLVVGWTLIALPVQPVLALRADDVGRSLRDQGLFASEIVRWDQFLGGWSSHLVTRSSNNFTVSPVEGYFARVKSSSGPTFRISGLPISQPQTVTGLVTGWDIVAVPYPTTYVAESLGQAMIAQGLAAQQIVKWNEALGAWSAHLVGWTSNNFSIERGRSYFVRLTAVNATGEFRP
ncbi:MAG: fibronectin type III domain-containing protein [Chloroflexi bacterium]|nr:fibronectin type III domain-containing protein [Chloroflexota bacterium]